MWLLDAIGGTSPEAPRAGLERVTQAGGKPISWVSLACELQRDWAREETVADVVEIEARVKRLRSRMGQLEGVARVNGRIVVDGIMTFALGPMPAGKGVSEVFKAAAQGGAAGCHQ